MDVYDTDREILHSAIEWIDQGYDVALVTVAKTWGASPRPCGSMLVMRADGVHAGSVSGGCVEEDLLQRYKDQELSDHFPTRIDYGVDRQEAARFGLPCGGRLELVVEQLDNAVQLQTILCSIDAGGLITRRLCMNTGEVSLHRDSERGEFYYDPDVMQKVFGSVWHILLIGAGQLSRYAAKIALMLNYKVSVCDPREDIRAAWGMDGVTLISDMPDDAVAAMDNLQRGIVVTLTHDPKLDDMALMQALEADLFYVGALGSARSSAQRRERLAALGISQTRLAKLHAPVGLDIGSHSPAEIALAIMAEITALRNT